MKTLSADQFEAKYGAPTVAAPAATPSPTFASRVADSFSSRQQAASTELRSDAPLPEKALRTIGQSAGFIANDIPEAAISSIPQPVKNIAAKEVEAAIQMIPSHIRTAAGLTGRVLKVEAGEAMKQYDAFKAKHPEAAKDIEAVVNIAQLIPVERVLSLVGRGASALADKTASKVETLFQRPATSVEDAIVQADIATTRREIPPGTAPGEARKLSEAAAPELSVREKWIGISPDVKGRIAGKQEKLQGYFDVAHARNNNDLAPTPYEYGAKQAQNAVGEMENLLNETGGKIGQTRQKIGTYKATPDDVAALETSFNDQLSKLNLESHNGQVRQKGGTVAKVGVGDVKVLNELYQNLGVVKQSPTLTNIIDFRTTLDSRVNFAKQAREASSEVDPLSRKVRKDAADIAARLVGPSEAAEVKRFSDFMDAYSDLKSYTDRQAGGEYLLRLVLSGRGGEARQIVQTIKEYTGIDLMDDATMMTIATDVIGNPRQQNLFRQEMTKAGLDAARVLQGDVGGAASLLSNLMTKHLLDQEKIYLDAAK